MIGLDHGGDRSCEYQHREDNASNGADDEDIPHDPLHDFDDTRIDNQLFWAKHLDLPLARLLALAISFLVERFLAPEDAEQAGQIGSCPAR